MKRTNLDSARRLSAFDSGLLAIEHAHAPVHLGACAIVEGPLCPERLARRVESRSWRLGNLVRRLAPTPLGLARPEFEEAPHFDTRDHIHHWALPAPGGEAELLEACARILASPLDRARPLFEIHVIEALDGERSAAVCKINHSVHFDGAGGALLEALLDPGPEARDDLPSPRNSRRTDGSALRLARALGDVGWSGVRDALHLLAIATAPEQARDDARRLGSAAVELFQLAVTSPTRLPWNEPLGFRRRLELTRLPLDDARRLARAKACSVDLVVACALAGAIRRYLQSSGGASPQSEARALLPTRQPAGTRQHRADPVSVQAMPLAVDVPDDGLRLDVLKRLTSERDSRATRAPLDALLDLVARLPDSLAATFWRGIRFDRLANVLAATAQGPSEARWLCGQRLVAVYPFLPLLDGVGLSVATYTYDGALFVGIQADADRIPDLDKLRLALEESFSALLRAG